MAPNDSADAEPTPSATAHTVVPAAQRTDAAKAVWIKILKEQVDALAKTIRPDVESGLMPGEQVTAVMPDGTRIGKVSLSEVPEVVTVTDEKALIGWVQEHRPDEIVPTIRESYLNHLKDQVKKHGHAFSPNGEIIPGIGLDSGTPRFTPTPNDDGRRLVLSWFAGMMTDSKVLALPAADEAA